MTAEHTVPSSAWRSPVIVLAAGCLVAMIGFGIRSSLGLFLEPMTTEHGWDRQTYALAMAIQNLLWGLGMPFAGALADRYGPRWVLVGGAIAYAAGIWGMAVSTSGLSLQLTGGLLAGTGVAFTSFSLAMASMAKVVGPERRSFALGLGTAAGSAGQVIFSPIGLGFTNAFGWQTALFLLGGFMVLIIVLAFVLPTDTSAKGETDIGQSVGDAFREAIVHRGYVLLALGFFVCGFQISFITVHFPSYVLDLGLPAHVGAYSLSLVGLFNIVGAFIAGIWGQRYSKKIGLASLYFVRSLAVVGLLLLPKTEFSLYAFASVMGLFWLATVPLTTGLVAQVFGARYMAMLFGIVFLSHQIGSFLGVWLGGYLYDTTGSYDMIWWLCIALGFAATLIHLPIDDRPLQRLSAAGAPSP
jgi:MFS family permease